MRFRSIRLPVLASLAALTLLAGPASAADAPLTAGGSFAKTVPFIDGSIYEFECHATAPGASVTRVDSCTLSDGVSTLSAPPVSSGDGVAVTTGSYSLDSYQWKLCWKASATYSDGTSQSKSGCTAASSLGGAG